MYRSLTLAFLFLAPFATAQQTENTATLSRREIAELHLAYQTSRSDIDRLLIASRLARLNDFTYWSIVRREAEKVVEHDRQQPSSRPEIHILQPRQTPYHPSASTAAPKVQPASGGRTVYAGVDVQATELRQDEWSMLAFASAVPTPTPRNEKRLLKLALESPRPIIAGTAALGLARLHDVGAAESIAAAGRHWEDRQVFIEALVYLNDPQAADLAKELSGNDLALIESIKLTAESNRYDPFYTTRTW